MIRSHGMTILRHGLQWLLLTLALGTLFFCLGRLGGTSAVQIVLALGVSAGVLVAFAVRARLEPQSGDIVLGAILGAAIVSLGAIFAGWIQPMPLDASTVTATDLQLAFSANCGAIGGAAVCSIVAVRKKRLR